MLNGPTPLAELSDGEEHNEERMANELAAATEKSQGTLTHAWELHSRRFRKPMTSLVVPKGTSRSRSGYPSNSIL